MTTEQTIDIAGLKAVLEAGRNAPPEQFDMSDYECGTSACLIGWFCRTHPNDVLKMRLSPVPPGQVGCPRLADFTGMLAIKNRFNLSFSDVDYLFVGGAYDLSRDEALTRLEAFIARHEGK